MSSRSSAVVWASLLAAPLLAASLLALAGCSGRTLHDGDLATLPASDDPGGVRLELSFPSDVPLTSFNYDLKGPQSTQLDGSITVPSGSQTASLFLTALPPGSYQITIRSSLGSLVCVGSASFEPQAAQTIALYVALSCSRANPIGGPEVFNICPTITSLVDSSAHPAVNVAITVSATATDLDNDALAALWTATPGGSFSDPTSPTTEFRCTLPGPTQISITFTDARGCPTTQATTIDCP